MYSKTFEKRKELYRYIVFVKRYRYNKILTLWVSRGLFVLIIPRCLDVSDIGSNFDFRHSDDIMVFLGDRVSSFR